MRVTGRASHSRRGVKRISAAGRRFFAGALALVCAVTAVGVVHGLDRAPDRVQVQLKWVTQAQFVGYDAAKAKGFYAAEHLDVAIRPGGPDIVPEQVVAAGGAELGLGWLPGLLAAREQGAPLVNIAPVFAYSGMRQLAFKTSGIRGVADLRGRKVAVWFAGNEFPLLATPEKYKEGTAMLEDGIFVRADWLATNMPIAARFLRASLKGWEFCRDSAAQCVEIVLKESPILGREHHAWMMAEINKLIWGPPAPRTRPGRMDPDAFMRTADIALKFGIIRKPAEPGAYTHAVWELAEKKR